jgi:hypothetical protein
MTISPPAAQMPAAASQLWVALVSPFPPILDVDFAFWFWSRNSFFSVRTILFYWKLHPWPLRTEKTEAAIPSYIFSSRGPDLATRKMILKWRVGLFSFIRICKQFCDMGWERYCGARNGFVTDVLLDWWGIQATSFSLARREQFSKVGEENRVCPFRHCNF